MRVPTITPPPLPPGHARAAAVLAELRAADTSWSAPVASCPAAPMPRRHRESALYLAHVRVRQVRAVSARYDAIATELEAALAELAALAPLATLKAEVAK